MLAPGHKYHPRPGATADAPAAGILPRPQPPGAVSGNPARAGAGGSDGARFRPDSPKQTLFHM